MAQALLDACSRAASPARCVMPGQADEDEAFAVAIVVWLDNGDSVRVQVGLKRGEQAGEWLSRRIDFDDSDQEAERWTATGFVIGTLAGRFVEEQPEVESTKPEILDEAPTPEPEPEPTPEPEPEQRAEPEPEPVRPRGSMWINVGGLAGPAFNAGPWSYGAIVGTEYQGGGWPLFVHASLRGAYRPPDNLGVAAYFADGGLGLGLPIAEFSSAWAIRGAWSVALERMLVQVEDAYGERDDAAESPGRSGNS